MRKNRHSKGYTLAELIVSVGLAALLLLVIIQSTFVISKSHARARTYLDMNSTAIGAFSRFSRDIRRATSVDTVNSTLGASSGKLVLNMKKDDGSNDVTTFYLSSSTVREAWNGSDVGALSQGNIDVSNLTFRLFSVATTTAVRVEMTIVPASTSTVPALNFYGTYVLRGSYTE